MCGRALCVCVPCVCVCVCFSRHCIWCIHFSLCIFECDIPVVTGRYDHKDSGVPRPSRNIDVVRSYASLSTPSDCTKAYNAIWDEFGGKVQLCTNEFTATDASETAHYRAVYVIVEFVPANKETFGQKATRCRDEWIKFMESRDPLKQGNVRRAMTHLTKGGELANKPVRMLCEVQLMLDTYRATRNSMHLLYKATRLWRDFSGRVMSKPEETW